MGSPAHDVRERFPSNRKRADCASENVGWTHAMLRSTSFIRNLENLEHGDLPVGTSTRTQPQRQTPIEALRGRILLRPRMRRRTRTRARAVRMQCIHFDTSDVTSVGQRSPYRHARRTTRLSANFVPGKLQEKRGSD